jgi:hypothetical protein
MQKRVSRKDAKAQSTAETLAKPVGYIARDVLLL